jgi:hypothetical protein
MDVLFGATASQTEGLAPTAGSTSTRTIPAWPARCSRIPTRTRTRAGACSSIARSRSLASVYRFAHGVNIGLIARYQDGQPFRASPSSPISTRGTTSSARIRLATRASASPARLDMAAAEGLLCRARGSTPSSTGYNLFNLGTKSKSAS